MGTDCTWWYPPNTSLASSSVLRMGLWLKRLNVWLFANYRSASSEELSVVVNLCSSENTSEVEPSELLSHPPSAPLRFLLQDVNSKAGQQSVSHQTTCGPHCFSSSVSSPDVSSIEFSCKRCADLSLLSVLMRIAPMTATSCSEFHFYASFFSELDVTFPFSDVSGPLLEQRIVFYFNCTTCQRDTWYTLMK